MNRAVNFCGASGASYGFERIEDEAAWRDRPGIALFASDDCSGWRVIDVADQDGRQPQTAVEGRWRKARRFGASAIFFRPAPDDRRGKEAADLRQGLDPVFVGFLRGEGTPRAH